MFGVQSTGALDVLEQVYAIPLTEATPVVRCDLATAELIKTAANAFLATKISFINSMAQMCQAAGGDVVLLADALGYDKRIGREFLNAGLGFGGGCLPKDIRALAVRAEELEVGVLSQLIEAVEAINSGQRTELAELAVEQLGGDVSGSGSPCSGPTFKPGTDDTRNSPALTVADQLHAAGARVMIYDPQARLPARDNFTQVGSVDEAVTGAEIVLHLTEWPEFRYLDPGDARRAGQEQDHHRRPAEAARADLARRRLEGRPDRPRRQPLTRVVSRSGGRATTAADRVGADQRSREGRVEGGRRTHHGGGQLVIGTVVATDVGRRALHGEQLVGDHRLLLPQLGRQRAEVGRELRVLGLRGQLLGPEQRQVEVRPAVVDRADPAGRGLVLVQERAGGAIQGVGQHLCPLVVRGLGQVLQATRPAPGTRPGCPSAGSSP